MNDLQKDLSVPIVSHEALMAVVRKHRLQLPSVEHTLPPPSAQMRQITGASRWPWETATVWPLQRDMLREAQGVYAHPTEVLLWLRGFQHIAQLWPHVSREDGEMVAYTTDMEAGQKDRKVRISMGRFLRRFLPLYTDDAIRKMEAAHRAELDPTVEVVHGLDEVERVYTRMAGDNACMRYAKEHFGHKVYHPSAVYASPGFGVAVLRDAKGTVKARSVVWENPQDADDKRYVRVYGDPTLERKLQRAGYKLRGLKGAKMLALHEASHEATRFVMPYLDPAGGIHYNGVKDDKYDARSVVRYDDDPEYLHLVTATERTQLVRLGVRLTDCSSQSGSVEVPMSLRAQVSVTCAVTHKVFSRLEHDTVRWMNADGSLAWAMARAIPKEATHRQLGLSGQMVPVYALEATFEGRCLPVPCANCVDTPESMVQMGVVWLDEVHYGARVLGARHHCAQVGNAWIRNEDAYRVEDNNGGERRFIHKDEVALVRKMGYVSVNVLSGMKLLVHKSDTRLRQTAKSKRRVLLGVHQLTTLYDGSVEFERNATRLAVGGFSVRVLTDNPEHQRAAFVPDEDILDAILGAMTLANARVRTRFMSHFGHFLHESPSGQIVDASYTVSAVMPESIIAAARRIVAMPQEEVARLHYRGNSTLPWARCVLRCVELSRRNFEAACERAEAMAMEVESSRIGSPESDNFDDAIEEMLRAPAPQFMRTTATSTAINPAAAWPFDPRATTTASAADFVSTLTGTRS